MARRLRIDRGGYVYHVLNRRIGQKTLFAHSADYAAMEEVLAEAQKYQPMRLVTYCLMPNHWHLVLWPRKDGELSRFMQWLTVTHMRRWHARNRSAGTGPLYQGRFRSFPVQDDNHLRVVCRYVERNALRARKVRRAENWPWSGLYRRSHEPLEGLLGLKDWPVSPGRNWTDFVNRAETDLELEALRRSANRGAPFGDEAWQRKTAARLRLESSMRDPWRPRKEPGDAARPNRKQPG